jgi:hypothetical protein
LDAKVLVLSYSLLQLFGFNLNIVNDKNKTNSCHHYPMFDENNAK